MVKIILLSKVLNLGKLGDIVDVKAGYARNYLVPYEKALYATKNNVEKFQEKIVLNKKILSEKIANINYLANCIRSLSPLSIEMRSKNNKKLFGSISSNFISQLFFDKLKANISSKCIIVPGKTIKYLGKYKLSILLYKGIKVECLLNVIKKK